MRHAIRKPCDMLFNNFAAQLTESNNFLPLLPGSDATKNMPPEELNEILLYIFLIVGLNNPTYRDVTSR